jgi:SAM-dependent methyltransferase
MSPLRRTARWLYRLFDPHARSVERAERLHPGELLQPSGETREDRHPALFAELQRRLGAEPAPRLLSFGCSTGAEAFTLLRYLPKARIDAIDLNPRAIAKAQALAKRRGVAAIRFACSGKPPAEGPVYDAILCLSVLRHGDLDAHRPASCNAVLPFARFDAAVRTGGLLAIWGSNFRFADASVAARYRAIDVPGTRQRSGAVYGPDDRLLEQQGQTQFLFEKLR